MRSYFFYFFVLILLENGLMGQSQVNLTLPEITLNVSGEQPCLPVVADSFPAVAALQFSLGWDPTIVNYSEVQLGTNPLGLGSNETFNPTDSTFGLSWLAPTPAGLAIESGSVLFSLCFTPMVDTGSTSVFFGSYLPSEFVRTDTLALFPTDLTDGNISVINNPASNSREPGWGKHLSIGPIPLSGPFGLLTISHSDYTYDFIDLVDLRGRQLLHFTGEAKKLDLSLLAPGLYFLRFHYRGTYVIRRVIRQ